MQTNNNKILKKSYKNKMPLVTYKITKENK